jgi:hypothetical protein
MRLELVNESDDEVVVLGYQDEPYLRVAPDGVYENLNSPATYLNTSTSGDGSPPDGLITTAAPRWRQLSSGREVRWHDHRSHWMAPTPPSVLADPGRQQLLEPRWVIPITIDGQRVEAVGSISWVPGPNPMPHVIAAVLLAGVVTAVACTSRWRIAAIVAAGLLLAACAADAVGSWAVSSDPILTRAAALATPCIAAGLLIAGLVMGRWREREALVLIGGGGVALALLFGWVSRNYLTMSQIPTTLAPELARLTVTVAFGIGGGLALLPLARYRRELRLALQPSRRARRGGRPVLDRSR